MTPASDPICLYEDNAGTLHLHCEHTRMVYSGVGDSGSIFEDDARYLILHASDPKGYPTDDWTCDSAPLTEAPLAWHLIASHSAAHGTKLWFRGEHYQASGDGTPTLRRYMSWDDAKKEEESDGEGTIEPDDGDERWIDLLPTSDAPGTEEDIKATERMWGANP